MLDKFWKTALENQGLVIKWLTKNMWIVRKSNSILEFDDYKQIGLMILRDAAEKYDSRLGTFSSFAWKRLKWYMRRAYVEQAFPIMRVNEPNIPKPDCDLSAMTFKQSFTYNVIYGRVNMSCCGFMKIQENKVEE